MAFVSINRSKAGGFLWGLGLAGLLGAGWALLPAAAGFQLRPAAAPAGQAVPAGQAALAGQAAPAGQAAKPAPEAPAAHAFKTQPPLHAQNAAMRTCLPAIDELSRQVIDGDHTALSTWHQQDADGRLFQSLVGLHYASAVAPHALSVLVASPRRDAAPGTSPCDGATVQVHPSQLSCGQIAASLQSPAGAKPAAPALDLKGVKIIQTGGATRVALVPLQPQGCIVVGLGVYYAR